MKTVLDFEAAGARFSASLLKKVDLFYPNQRIRMYRQFGLRNGTFTRV